MQMAAANTAPTEPLSKTVLDKIGQNIFRCYQCVKCTSGCPIADQFDLTPNQVMRSLQLNDPSVLRSKAIWLCASCQTCTTRCPQDINVTGVMDLLRIEASNRGIPSAVPDIQQFNWLFMQFVKYLGRMPELIFIVTYKLLRGKPFADMGMGLRMLKKGKFKLLPHFARTPKKVKPLTDPIGKVAYFPGCAASSTSKDYDHTVRSTADVLNIELVEPPGWVCCGSSCAHATDSTQANVLPLRTLSTIERMGMTKVTSPCSNCFSRLKMAEHEGVQDKQALESVEAITTYKYQGKVDVQHFVDTIMDHATPEQISRKVKRPLDGLKVACYYGCLMTRPAQVTGAENPEYPMKMDYLLQSLGAETVDWSYKTDCCGGALSVTQTEVSLKMSKKVVENAKECGAEAVITMCPMCHMNLDARQADMKITFDMPIFHSTQLTTLAFGLDAKKSHFNKNLVDPMPLLQSKKFF
ncbi:MAG: heterodisulfide reductase-related iron-sulfur binding cluster [Gammaproteobacteria bacterium]|nr:heterodisulfide reductase-related iron-sulfur binding cluster [Gammaproteobacteria bacterium]MDH3468277.1 heterodisulfide reductase-related iron-sulfur binding cluster [Gammaproteobacteria bacterium]